MTAAKYDINIDQGSDFEISIVIEEDDDSVVDIFVAAETSPTTYVIKSILE